jgi:hypothetical protein
MYTVAGSAIHAPDRDWRCSVGRVLRPPLSGSPRLGQRLALPVGRVLRRRLPPPWLPSPERERYTASRACRREAGRLGKGGAEELSDPVEKKLSSEDEGIRQTRYFSTCGGLVGQEKRGSHDLLSSNGHRPGGWSGLIPRLIVSIFL